MRPTSDIPMAHSQAWRTQFPMKCLVSLAGRRDSHWSEGGEPTSRLAASGEMLITVLLGQRHTEESSGFALERETLALISRKLEGEGSWAGDAINMHQSLQRRFLTRSHVPLERGWRHMQCLHVFLPLVIIYSEDALQTCLGHWSLLLEASWQEVHS